MRIKENIYKLSRSNMQKRKITLKRLSCAMACFAVVGLTETTCKKPDQDSTASQKVLVKATPRPEFGWLHDYNKAQEEAKANHKLLLLNFTGSDWCGWCIRLDQDVFSKPDFKDFASKNLVLLELDFPRPGGSRSQGQTAELKKQNLELARQYNVYGFPTLIVLDGNGQKLWQFEGYLPGAELIAQLEKLHKG
jgi:protein disulfide-isomerase